MRLSKLEIYGFKSFAKRTEIIFPQNVTGIVGPNGSGKSNISDAVRWVLGEQSAKTLRGNSMSDVIFNGTEKRKAMNYCEVTLVFDNSDQQLPVNFSEVSITRRVYRSGESEYLLNGSDCRLKDIVDLFRDTGVGKEGYSIIGQGRIDEILSQRGEDRRAVFEEAAGISRFRARKEEAEQRLKRSDENLVRVVDLIEELQDRLEPLEKQASVAKEYLALSETLRELDVELYLIRHDRLNKRTKSMEDALLAIKDQLLDFTKQLEALGVDREKQEAEVEALQKALNDAHDALLNKNELLHRAKERAQNVANRLQTGAETVERLTGEADALRTRQKLIEATMSQSSGGLDEAERQRLAAERALAERKQAQTAATQAAQKWEDELSAHKTAIMDSMNRMQNVRTTQARQSAMLSQMSARRQELADQLQGENEREQELASALETAKANLQSEQTLLDQRKAEQEALELRAKTLFDETQTKQKAAQELAQSARADETRLKTLRELQEGYEGYQYPVRQALTHAKQQGWSGVHDVVAMLLNVPKRYETALDMALGGAMQNIVTETEQDAKRLIDYLRQNRLGRATFLPISTIRGRTLSERERSVLSMKGCVGVASELCAFDERYRSIFENLLGRTVIAEDLESGIQIMRAGNHAFRLVTLAGDVMHSGGSMTGGSIQQKAQNLLGREREIKELAEKLAASNERMTEAQQALAAMEVERGELREKRISARYEVQQQEIAVVRDTERLKTAQNAAEEHRRSAEGMEQAIAQLNESIADIENELKRIEEQTGREELDTDAMNRKTEELSATLDKARRERENAQDALTQAMLDMQEAEHTCERLRSDNTRLTSDRENCVREIEALEGKRQRALTDMESAKGEQSTAQETITLAEEGVEQAKHCVDETELAREEASKALKDLQNEIEGCRQLAEKTTEREHRQEMNLTRVKTDLTQLNDRLWDTYELTFAGAVEAHNELLLLQTQGQEALDALRAARKDGELDENGEPLVPQIDPDTPVEPLPNFDEASSDARATDIRERIKRMGNVNVAAIEEYAQLRERFTELSAQRDDLEQAKKDLLTLISNLLENMQTQFVGQFELLRQYFEETFVRLFGGGHGEILLSDPTDPLNCGIEIIVQPPGKKRQLLSLFSGGERALTAIAILFAMLKLKPTPFCILDEIEAALDEANITYFADYLKEFSVGTQFVVVTHRKGTMERCDTLFGVAMEERGVSSMVSVSLKDYE